MRLRVLIFTRQWKGTYETNSRLYYSNICYENYKKMQEGEKQILNDLVPIGTIWGSCGGCSIGTIGSLF